MHGFVCNLHVGIGDAHAETGPDSLEGLRERIGEHAVALRHDKHPTVEGDGRQQLSLLDFSHPISSLLIDTNLQKPTSKISKHWLCQTKIAEHTLLSSTKYRPD